MSRQGQTSNIQILDNLSKKINEIKGNIPYNKLVENTNKYLNKTYTKKTNEGSIIKENFIKYINILKHLYKYYIYYEKLLTKYKGNTNHFNEILKQSYKKKVSNNSDNELNAEKIRNKIIDILDKKKQKVRKLLDNLTEKIMENFKSLSEEEYYGIKKKYSKNNKFKKLFSMFVSIKKKKQSEKNLVENLINYLDPNKKKKHNSTPIKINNEFERFNFSKAKKKTKLFKYNKIFD